MKKILLVVFCMLVVFLGYVALQPAEMNISRELLVNAKPALIFPHINNAKKADHWMPWAESDPGMKILYSGPEEGVGSTSSWDSAGKMGTGQAQVVESIANKVVKTQLTYVKPMQMSQMAEISLIPTESGTIVRWGVTGKNNFVGRLFCVFMNMEKMVGGEFEKGLANLKSIVEAQSK